MKWTPTAVLAALTPLLLTRPATTMAQLYGAVDDGLGLLPRSYEAAAPALARRQAGCRTGTHPCNDINAAAFCCANDSYCIVDPGTQGPACCKLGSTCSSPCDAAKFQCNATTTLPGAPAATTLAACCQRRCPATSQFACPFDLGGGCCAYGQTCAPSSSCVAAATTSSAVSTRVSMLPPGCTTSQIACAASDGGGCCSVGYSCTVVDRANYCAVATVTPTGNVSAVAVDPGLSTAAKAGIGAGVAVAACAVIAGVTWFCLRRRRDERSRESARRRGGPGGSGAPVSEANSDGASRGGPLRGLAQDYFGPTAGVGPYTQHEQDTSQATTPGRGPVPMAPQDPQDIVAPVEIDSNAVKPEDVAAASRRVSSQTSTSPPVRDTIDGRFELHGSDYPSPPSEEPTPLSQGVVSPVSESGLSRAVSSADRHQHNAG